MAYESNLITHIHAVNESLKKFNGSAELNPETLNLKVRARGKYVELGPQFIFPKEGSIAFSPRLLPEAQAFCGWRAYFNRVWTLAVDKLAFKDFCNTNGLLSPRRWLTPDGIDADVILKKARSSFAQGILGPFTPGKVRSRKYDLGPGDFFEEFIHGAIVKVWYWNEKPVALDVRSMPAVLGDGKATLRELMTKASIPHVALDWDACNAIAEFQGLGLDEVVKTDKKVIVDYRYLSFFHPLSTYLKDQNCLAKYVGTPLMKQLEAAGQVFHSAIPESVRLNTLYSVDAIANEHDQAVFLEMNCNPIVHPAVYSAMFDSLLGPSSIARH